MKTTDELFPAPSARIMSLRPISMTADSIHAIREHRKTQTRRVIYPQPAGMRPVQDSAHPLQWRGEGGQHWRSPYGVPSDELWVREVWALVEPYPASVRHDYKLPVAWRVEKNQILLDYWRKRVIFYGDYSGMTPEQCVRGATDNKWHSPVTMPRWAARLWLKVTDIRPERVQEISEADAQAEGIQRQSLPDLNGNRYHWGDPSKDRYKTAVAAYAALWDSINGKKNPWASNPWVWRIEFEQQ
jgi:hypothetical protein